MAGPGEWITLTTEEPVDPRRRIVDAHHHLYDRGADHYLLADLLADTGSGHNVTHTVVVEGKYGYRTEGPDALRPVGETEFFATQAAASDTAETQVAAIVSFADLTLGDGVQEVLDAHAAAGAGRLRGIRHASGWDEDPDVPVSHHEPRRQGLLADPRFVNGVRRLGLNGYSFDAWLYHPQLPELADLARAADSTVVVVNHLGGPLRVGRYADRSAVRVVWRQGLSLLADCPNVTLKLGGVGQDRSLFRTGWSAQERPPTSDQVVQWWQDDIRWCIDTFGPSRCMFESNYPVDRQSVGYTVLWNAFQNIASVYTDDEQDSLFWRTAAEVYALTLDDDRGTVAAPPQGETQVPRGRA